MLLLPSRTKQLVGVANGRGTQVGIMGQVSGTWVLPQLREGSGSTWGGGIPDIWVLPVPLPGHGPHQWLP